MSGENVSVWILGDQLLARHPALAAAEQITSNGRVHVVLVESAARVHRLAYQRKKLVLLFSAMRHYAAELREQGFHVDYLQARSFLEGLRQHLADCQITHLVTMAASEYRTRVYQQAELSEALGIPTTIVPNTQFLVGQYEPYPQTDREGRVVMAHFYQRMRRHFDVLLSADGQPVGEKWSFDAENRKRLPQDAQPPQMPVFRPDAITRQVMAEVEAAGHGVGSVQGFELATDRAQALTALDDFLARRLSLFGPYQDAMSSRHATLYHSLLSPYLNIGLLEPMELIRAAEQAFRQGRAPINSVEGFVRQVLGWREFIYWQYWRLMPGLAESNAWKSQRPLPRFFWEGTTEMQCLRSAIERAIETGYNHHIERLMLLCNFCLLAGVRPRAVNDWFLSCYVDAYEWVMVPNVMGMGLHADGGLIATKPYIASANYIHRMSDYCRQCRYDHKLRTGPDSCPFNYLHWNFLIEHETTLRANPRLGRNVLGLRHLDQDERRAVRDCALSFLDRLAYHDP